MKVALVGIFETFISACFAPGVNAAAIGALMFFLCSPAAVCSEHVAGLRIAIAIAIAAFRSVAERRPGAHGPRRDHQQVRTF
jgi:hypothetical protein